MGGDSFDLTTQLFQYFDDAVRAFVDRVLSDVTQWTAMIASLLLTIYIMISSFFSIMGNHHAEPITTLFKTYIVAMIIVSFAGIGGLYQTELADAALRIPDEIASVVMGGGPADGSAAAQPVDMLLEKGINITIRAFEHGSIFSGEGLAMIFVGVVAIIATAIICAFGLMYLISAKILLAVVACFGSLFIYALLFNATRGLFERWVGAIVHYGFIAVLMAAVFMIVLVPYERALNSLAVDAPVSASIGDVVSCVVICVVACYTMKLIPDLAASFGNGVAVGYRKIMERRPSAPVPAK